MRPPGRCTAGEVTLAIDAPPPAGAAAAPVIDWRFASRAYRAVDRALLRGRRSVHHQRRRRAASAGARAASARRAARRSISASCSIVGRRAVRSRAAGWTAGRAGRAIVARGPRRDHRALLRSHARSAAGRTVEVPVFENGRHSTLVIRALAAETITVGRRRPWDSVRLDVLLKQRVPRRSAPADHGLAGARPAASARRRRSARRLW